MTGSDADPGSLRTIDRAGLCLLACQRVAKWDRKLRDSGVPLWRPLLCGSAQIGLLEATKPARYCGSPHPPPRPRIIELDVRLFLAAETDLTSSRLPTRIAATTGTRLADPRSSLAGRRRFRWPCLSAHHILTNRTAIGWEVCVNVEPYFETTPYWADVFTSSAITAQRHSRTFALRNNLSRNDYETLKARQGQEFRWRLSMAIAHLPAELLPASLQNLAADLDRYPAVKAMIGQAHAGQLPAPAWHRGQTLTRRQLLPIGSLSCQTANRGRERPKGATTQTGPSRHGSLVVEVEPAAALTRVPADERPDRIHAP